MRRFFSSLSVVILGLSASACVSGDGGEAAAVPGCTKVQPAGFPTTAEGIANGQTAPDLAMKDMAGNDVCLRDYTGKVVMINSAAGWCPPCRDETPGIQNVYEQYKDQGFEVLMAMFDDYNANAAGMDDDFMAQWQSTYGITFKLIYDPQAAAYTTYVQAEDDGYIPLTIILDRDHVIRYSAAGGLSENNLRNMVGNWVDTAATLEYE